MLRLNKLRALSIPPEITDNVFARYNSNGSNRQDFWNYYYYPRFPNQKDPDIVPSKLFMVQMTKPFKGQPWWDRKLLVNLGFNERVEKDRIVIIKNIPEMCSALWRVKHLVKITPITFPDGEPTEEDIGRTYLSTTGEMFISEKYRVDPAALQAEKDYQSDEKYLDKETKKRDSMYQWSHGWDLD